MDAFLIARLALELEERWAGAHVQDFWQDEVGRLILRLRGRGRTGLLLLSPLPEAPGFGLVARRPACPPRPPALAAFLRARVRGGALREVRALPYERVLELGLGRTGESVRVVLEATGRRGNLLACDGDGTLRVAHRWEDETRSRLRPVQPGTVYRPPPDPRDVLAPDQVSREQLTEWIERGDALHRRIAGLGPNLGKEVVHRAAHGEDPWTAFVSVVSAYGRPGPVWEYEDALSAVELTHRGSPERVHDDALEAAGEWSVDRLRSVQKDARTRERLRQERRHRERLERRIHRIRCDLEALPDVEDLRARADSLAAVLWTVSRSDRKIQIPDVRDPEKTFELDLEPDLSPGGNLDRLYREAGRAERTRRNLIERLELSEMELREGRPSSPAPRDVPEGVIPRKPFRRFISSDGWSIWVGRNGAENDRLLRQARPWDLWFHARGGSGAHVLVRKPGREARPPQRTVTEAAGLAAWYSSARSNTAVDVMVAEVSRVHKPRGASPGRVVVAGERTVRVPPGAGSPRAAAGAQAPGRSAR